MHELCPSVFIMSVLGVRDQDQKYEFQPGESFKIFGHDFCLIL